MTHLSKPLLIVAMAGGLLTVQACSASGTRETTARSAPREPAYQGTQVGVYRSSDTGKEYQLHDIDGDGALDFVQDKITNEWYKLTNIDLTPIDIDVTSVDLKDGSHPEP